jgi:hypothetical protein
VRDIDEMGAELVVLDLPGAAGGVPLLARAVRSIMLPTRDGSRSREPGSGQGLVSGHGFEAPRPRAETMGHRDPRGRRTPADLTLAAKSMQQPADPTTNGGSPPDRSRSAVGALDTKMLGQGCS